MRDELSRCVAWYAATRARVESGIVPVQLLEAFAGGLHPLRRSWHDWTGGAHLFWIGYERTPGGPVRYSACPQRAGPLFNFTTGLYPRRAHHNGPERKLGLERERERERSGQPLGWRREIRDRIAELESHRVRLEEERVRARDEATEEGERLEAELRAELQQISEQINDLRASLE
jgi:hypothetical protein